MSFEQFEGQFNRAFLLSFKLKRLLFLFIALAICGLIAIFFRTLAIYSGPWMAMNLCYLPLLIGTAILMASGVILVRAYPDEIKDGGVSYREMMSHSWQRMLVGSYFALPLILAYIILWLFLGIFVLLSYIPSVGPFFAALLAFVPFLINCAILSLCVLAICLLFFILPRFSLGNINPRLLPEMFFHNFWKNPLQHLALLTVGIIPAILVFCFLSYATCMTIRALNLPWGSLHEALMMLMILIPFLGILTPAVLFFFNFATEAYQLLKKGDQSES